MTQTLVTFHAHPDDESIATGGVMARAAAEGHRVVLVLATQGEVGEVPPDYLGLHETLADRRVQEVEAAAEILGVARVAYLGYRDSGMMHEPTNDHPEAFWQAAVDTAAEQLADILREEHADVLTIYDDNGGYGHPDHIQVHRVGLAAAHLAGTPRIYESVVNRDRVRRLLASIPPDAIPEGVEIPDFDALELGVSESRITTTVDVRAFADQKRAAMRAHGSQISSESFFLQLPDAIFRESFGYECFIRRDVDPALRETSIFGG